MMLRRYLLLSVVALISFTVVSHLNLPEQPAPITATDSALNLLSVKFTTPHPSTTRRGEGIESPIELPATVNNAGDEKLFPV